MRRWTVVSVLFAALFLALCRPAEAQRLHLAELKGTPKKITVKWDPSPQGPFSPPSQNPATASGSVVVATTWGTLMRSPGSTALPYDTGTTTQFEDTDWNPNAIYEYWMVCQTVSYSRAFNPQSGWYWSGPVYTFANSPKIRVEVRAVGVTAAATADSRLDMRFATEKLLDYTFNAVPASDASAVPTLYRGGLFAGFQQDSSRVGRSYLRFNAIVPTPSSTLQLWPIGGLQVFVPRLAKTGSVSLTTRKLSDEMFSIDSLVWSNAPSLGASTARSETVSWSATSPIKQWVTINVSPDVQEAINTDGSLALSLMSSNETSAGWLYAARPGYIDPTYTLPPNSITPPNGLAPYLLFAVLGPGANLSSISLTPGVVTSGSGVSVTGIVSISSISPTGGLEVSLGSNNSAASVPNSVIIPAGQSSISFPITWSSVTSATTATITAVMGNVLTAGLTVNPASGGGGGGGGGGGTGTLSNLVITPGNITVGGTATGTITLSAPAPAGGTAVTLSSSNTNAAQVPGSVTVTAGQTTKTFSITTGPGMAYYQPATITATSGNVKTASLFVTPGGPPPVGN
jgi:hypothetical protein